MKRYERYRIEGRKMDVSNTLEIDELIQNLKPLVKIRTLNTHTKRNRVKFLTLHLEPF